MPSMTADVGVLDEPDPDAETGRRRSKPELAMREAVASGLCAAAAAAAGKVAFGEPAEAVSAALAAWARPDGGPATALEAYATWAVRAVFAACMLGLNGTMISLYVRALSRSGTLVGTVTNTAVNVLASSALGQLLFGEEVGASWLAGAFVTVVGIACIQRAQAQGSVKKQD